MYILTFVIGIPLALLIYLTLRFLKRPITPEHSAQIAGTTLGIIQIIPAVLFIVAIVLVVPLLPFATLVWIFHSSWLYSLSEGMPKWFGVPSFVWFGAAILAYWLFLGFDWARTVWRAKKASPTGKD
jgi:hypothetical protein